MAVMCIHVLHLPALPALCCVEAIATDNTEYGWEYRGWKAEW
jgi:hypothetical protein